MVFHVDVVVGWNDMLAIIINAVLVCATLGMMYYLYKTLNHSIFVASSNILLPYKTKFFSEYRNLYVAIMSNAENQSDAINYDRFVGPNGENLFADMLNDLEMLSIMTKTKTKTIHENMVFEVFGTLLLTLQNDLQATKFIESRQSSTDGKLQPYGGLQKLMHDCYNYKHEVDRHSFIRFRRF